MASTSTSSYHQHQHQNHIKDHDIINNVNIEDTGASTDEAVWRTNDLFQWSKTIPYSREKGRILRGEKEAESGDGRPNHHQRRKNREVTGGLEIPEGSDGLQRIEDRRWRENKKKKQEPN